MHSRHSTGRLTFFAVVPLITSCAAFILTLLCLLAGTKTTSLQNADLFTVNVSRIGHTDIFKNANLRRRGLVGDLDNIGHKIGDGIEKGWDEVKGEVEKALDDFESDIAELLNLPDFFSVHILDFCTGEFEPNTTDPHPAKNVTACTGTQTMFNFNLTEIIGDLLPSGLTLANIFFPNDITQTTNDVENAVKAVPILFIIATALTGLSFLLAIVRLAVRRIVVINLTVDILATLIVLVPAIMTTIIIVKAVKAINEHGSAIGIAATEGHLFLGMAWAAVGLILISTICSGIAVGRHRAESRYYHRRNDEKYQHSRY